jgi:hypothetical protein
MLHYGEGDRSLALITSEQHELNQEEKDDYEGYYIACTNTERGLVPQRISTEGHDAGCQKKNQQN